MSDIEAVKAWLLELRDVKADAEYTNERLDTLRSRAESPRTSSLDGMPHGGGFQSDRTGALVAQLEELEKENSRLWTLVGELRRERESWIRKIEAPGYAELKTILRLRYIDGEIWSDISFFLFGGKEDYLERPDAYLRRTFKAHGRALGALADLNPLASGRQENNTEKE